MQQAEIGGEIDRKGRIEIFRRQLADQLLFAEDAGILGRKQPVGDLRPEDFDAALAINLTANFRLLHRLDPLLRKSAVGRALFVTSGVAWKRHAAPQRRISLTHALR